MQGFFIPTDLEILEGTERGEERVSEDVVIVRRFAIERGLDSRGGDCRGVGEDENHGVASTVSGWRR